MKTKADEYLELARQREQERHESFERSDTDGFLTQWSAGLNAELYREKARIEQDNGYSEFYGLYEGTRRVLAKQVRKFNRFAPWVVEYQWMVHRDDPVYKTRKYIPTGENSRIQKALGLSEKKELQKSFARLDSVGTGLSGHCWVGVHRIGDEWGKDARLKD